MTVSLDDLIRTLAGQPAKPAAGLAHHPGPLRSHPTPSHRALVQQWGLSYTAIRSVVSLPFPSASSRAGATRSMSATASPTACWATQALIAQLCQRLNVAEGITRPDGLVSVHRTACTGLCDQGPAGLVNGRPLVMLTPRRIDEIADLILLETPLDAWPTDFFAVHNPRLASHAHAESSHPTRRWHPRPCWVVVPKA